MISSERINNVKKNINIRNILDDFSIARTNNNCRCPNPEHEDKHPSCLISDGDGKKYDYPSVYCLTDGERWDNIHLYLMLKKYDPKIDFIKAIIEMESRYLFEDHSDEFTSNKKILKSTSKSELKFKSIEEEQSFIINFINNRNKDYKVTEIHQLMQNGIRYLDQYFYSRGINYSFIDEILRNNNINIYHAYDKKYKSNYIVYDCPKKESNRFLLRKRIDSYLPKNEGKNIKKFKGNIGLYEPIFIHTSFKCENKKLVICEGIEDAFSFLMQGKSTTVVSLNSTNSISKFINIFDEIYESYIDYSIIIAMDNDKSGKKAKERLEIYFVDKGYIIAKNLYSYKFTYSNANDVNDEWITFLKSDPKLFDKIMEKRHQNAEIII